MTTTHPAPTLRGSVASYVSSVAGNYAFLVLSFGISIYLTRTLGPEGFGRLTLVLAVAQTVSLFACFWTQAGFLRHGTEELARSGNLRRVFWARMLVASVPLAGFLLLGWPLRHLVARFHGVADVGYAALATYLVALFVAQTLQVMYQARGRAGLYAFVQAGERALVLAGLLLYGLTAAPGQAAVLALYVAASLAASVAAAALVDRHDVVPVGTTGPTVRRFAVFSWPILLGVFGSYLTSNWLDVVVHRHFLGSEAVGQFALAYQLMGAVQQVPMVSFPVVVPYLVAAHVAGRVDTIDTYLERVVPHAVFGMVALLSAGIVIGPLVIVPVFGAGFAAAARALPVLLFAVGWYCVFIAYIPLLNLRERTRAMLVASLAAAAANVGGNLLLVPRWGVDGAAWAAVASQAAGA
ncbi:MAG: lipopolysaccharide biosynthesis protein, partial [Candidatus Rokubacteria bacterium]|nr:lipopolysaccharide biosynthesis protein [Candidatus Rokubacteria bacterium]